MLPWTALENVLTRLVQPLQSSGNVTILCLTEAIKELFSYSFVKGDFDNRDVFCLLQWKHILATTEGNSATTSRALFPLRHVHLLTRALVTSQWPSLPRPSP